MTKFLMLLIHKMNTCDLNKNSAAKIKKTLYNQWKSEFARENNSEARKSQKIRMKQKIDH